MLEDGIEELPVMVGIQRSLEDRQIAVDADESQRLLPLRWQIGAGHHGGPVTGKAVLVVQTQVIGLGDHVDAVLAEKDHEQSVEIAPDLAEKGHHVGGAERDAGGADHLAALALDADPVGVARRLAPGVIGEKDMPLLADLVYQVGRKRHRLRGGEIERPKGIAVAVRGGNRGVETDANHVDDAGAPVFRYARDAYVAHEAALPHVNAVAGKQLAGLADPRSRLALGVLDNQLKRPSIDTARGVDAFGGDLLSNLRHQPTAGGGTGQRLNAAHLYRLFLAEYRTPRRRHQHGSAERSGGRRGSGSHTHKAPPGNRSRAPNGLICPPAMPFFPHARSLPYAYAITHGPDF